MSRSEGYVLHREVGVFAGMCGSSLTRERTASPHGAYSVNLNKYRIRTQQPP